LLHPRGAGLSGSPITADLVTKFALFGAAGGLAGNLAGLHIGALGGVRNKGMGVADALARGKLIGTGTGAGAGVLVDMGIQALYPTDRECECPR
jgi:hypothetical protein